MDLGELIGDLAKALREARLQRGVEFLVHRLPHLLELRGVGLIQLLETLFDRTAELLLMRGVQVAEFRQACVQCVAVLAVLLAMSLAKPMKRWFIPPIWASTADRSASAPRALSFRKLSRPERSVSPSA